MGINAYHVGDKQMPQHPPDCWPDANVWHALQLPSVSRGASHGPSPRWQLSGRLAVHCKLIEL